MALSRSETQATWLIAIVIGAHLSLYGLPFINFEWAFFDAARYFEDQEAQHLERYFRVQANTLGVPYVAFLLTKLLPFVDIELLPRLLSTLGFGFLGIALLRLNRLLNSRLHPAILIAVVFLNPLEWTFGGRGTADFLPASLALLAVVLFWEGPRGKVATAIATVLFSVAIVLKYHAIVLLPLVWLEALSRPGISLRQALGRLSVVTATILLFPIAYLLVVKHSFGFWFIPATLQDQHSIRPDPVFVAENFSAYVAHAFIQTLPVSLFVFFQQIRGLRDLGLVICIATVLFFIGHLFMSAHGEMNFGPLDAYLDYRVMNGLFLATLCIFIPIVRYFRNSAPASSDAARFAWSYTVGAIIFIGILSISRPAQRYLLFILPLSFAFVLPLLATRKGLIGITLAFYMLMNIYIGLNHYATGHAATDLTHKIETAHLLELTSPGALIGHTGNRFPMSPATARKFKVVAGKSPRRVLFAESRPLPFIGKSFSLVPIQH